MLFTVNVQHVLRSSGYCTPVGSEHFTVTKKVGPGAPVCLLCLYTLTCSVVYFIYDPLPRKHKFNTLHMYIVDTTGPVKIHAISQLHVSHEYV